jgi:co-chaperonin GroES (HSP10)
LNPTPTPAAPILPETGMRCRIQPLGEQIIIRTIPQNSIGSILVPDSAKGITQKGSKGDMDAVHFVEAEVIAVGPGKRIEDRRLFHDMAYVLQQWQRGLRISEFEGLNDQTTSLMDRIENDTDEFRRRVPILVKPGDRILYHPAVQRFDRDITDVMSNGNEVSGSKYFMIREESVLAVIERT